MISDTMVRMIETHAASLAQQWLDYVRRDPDTFTYHSFPEHKLTARIENVYAHLNHWLQDADRSEVEEVYRRLGEKRFQEGFQLSEVVKALMVARRIVWQFVEIQGFSGAGELYRALEMEDGVNLFFDRAICFTVMGFEKEAHLQRTALRA